MSGAQARWASSVIEAFADAGVVDVVLSPGSRSTPFVLALLRCGRFRIHDVIDERSAGFFALGQARLTGRPSLLLCTSGTAGAHWYPAIIEASEAGIPLLALTADRPFELQGCRAPQTIDQTRLFGAHVRRFVELGGAPERPSTSSSARRMVAQAVADCLGPVPGPVHLNARGRKPLEPGEMDAIEGRPERPLVRTWTPIQTAPPDAVEALALALNRSKRGFIVCGAAPAWSGSLGEALRELATETGLPLCGEPASQLRFGDHAIDGDALDLLLESQRFLNEPVDFVLQVGDAPTSAGWERWRARHLQATHWVLSPWGWRDPTNGADAIVFGDPAATVRALLQKLKTMRTESRSPWTERVNEAMACAWQAEQRAREAESELSEAQAVRTLVARMPQDGVFVVGNSLPIRLVNQHCPSQLARCQVLSQRGANGIDGLVAGAAGAASMGRPTLLLLGDVSLVHDLGSLAVAARAQTSLVIVVLNNGGGRIFEQLPIAAQAHASALPHFTTPHPTDFASAAAAFGLSFHRVNTREALEGAVDVAVDAAHASLIEVVVEPDGAARMSLRVRATVDAAVRATWGETP